MHGQKLLPICGIRNAAGKKKREETEAGKHKELATQRAGMLLSLFRNVADVNGFIRTHVQDAIKPTSLEGYSAQIALCAYFELSEP